MSRGSHTFKLSDVTRALKATKAAGIEVSRIKINALGEIEIAAGKPSEINEAKGANEWDRAS